MIHPALLHPRRLVVVGASNNISKPGGKIVKNLLDHQYAGELYAVNPNETEIQGVRCYSSVQELPEVEMAVLAIPAALCPAAMEELARYKHTRAFIVISAGFSELDEEGKALENLLVEIAESTGSTLIGPNCIGVITQHYASVFTTPVPELHPQGCDFVSGSGATAVFILESGIPKGLRFSSIFSVGNSAQTGVEEVLEYWDRQFDPEHSSRVKLIYMESMSNPGKFLKHASSLVWKGCKIAAIKAGSSDAGSRAAGSHTGALASSDRAVDALFRKAGIVRCFGREELTTVASVFQCRELNGKNIGVITHAGGPAVMLTDVLENGGLSVPQIIDSAAKQRLKSKLPPGSSVENPIDFLATGTAGHLEAIINACEHDFEEIDAMAVIFGSPGLFPVHEVYDLLYEKMKQCRKPIYPILPSGINAKEEVATFISKGNVLFPDEVVFGNALGKVYTTPFPKKEQPEPVSMNVQEIRKIIGSCEASYLSAQKVHALLDAASISRVKEQFVTTETEAMNVLDALSFPLVMKVAGPVHKTEVGGVSLNVADKMTIQKEFQRLRAIEGATGVVMQEMVSGLELFIGAKYEPDFGHVILCGMGGIFVEVLEDVAAGLTPLSYTEAYAMIRSLRLYPLLQGYRGQAGVDEWKFVEILIRLSVLLQHTPEIKELDFNPLIGKGEAIYVADARIYVEPG